MYCSPQNKMYEYHKSIQITSGFTVFESCAETSAVDTYEQHLKAAFNTEVKPADLIDNRQYNVNRPLAQPL